MIHLADSSFWLDVGTDGSWILLRHTTGKHGATEELGRYTSPKHVLQQRKFKLPDEARAELQALCDAMDPDAILGQFPTAPRRPVEDG